MYQQGAMQASPLHTTPAPTRDGGRFALVQGAMQASPHHSTPLPPLRGTRADSHWYTGRCKHPRTTPHHSRPYAGRGPIRIGTQGDASIPAPLHTTPAPTRFTAVYERLRAVMRCHTA